MYNAHQAETCQRIFFVCLCLLCNPTIFSFFNSLPDNSCKIRDLALIVNIEVINKNGY